MSDLDDRIAEILDAKKDADLTVPLARGRVATAISAYIREHFADHAEELGLGPEYGRRTPTNGPAFRVDGIRAAVRISGMRECTTGSVRYLRQTNLEHVS